MPEPPVLKQENCPKMSSIPPPKGYLHRMELMHLTDELQRIMMAFSPIGFVLRILPWCGELTTILRDSYTEYEEEVCWIYFPMNNTEKVSDIWVRHPISEEVHCPTSFVVS